MFFCLFLLNILEYRDFLGYEAGEYTEFCDYCPRGSWEVDLGGSAT